MAELRVLTAEPQGESIVTLLENLLEMARAGELSSLAVAGVYRDGCVLAEWSDVLSLPILIGAAARLEHRLHLLADG